MQKNFDPLKITRLDSKGFGKAKDDKGRQYKVLGALPGEVVNFNVITKNRKNIYAVVSSVIEPSPYRVEPKDPETFVSSSVWQILNYNQEQIIKSDILKSEFDQYLHLFTEKEKALINSLQVVAQPESNSWFYRNKAEIAFYVHDDESITYGFHMQGCSKKKLPFTTSSIFSKNINEIGLKFLEFIKTHKISIKDLKYLVLRDHQEGVVARLCLKSEFFDFDMSNFQKMLCNTLKGIEVVYSNPQSPTAVCTKKLYSVGTCELEEEVLGKKFNYNFDHFFQINKEIFEYAINDMNLILDSEKIDKSQMTLVDLFSGVGVIGILLANGFKKVVAVELSEHTKEYALKNALQNAISNFEFIESDVDGALDVISSADILIVDPPRNGLTSKTIDEIKNKLPKYIIYLSCNHETFVNNLASLIDVYEITFLKGYNFFPHTPHIECLAFLKRKWDSK